MEIRRQRLIAQRKAMGGVVQVGNYDIHTTLAHDGTVESIDSFIFLNKVFDNNEYQYRFAKNSIQSWFNGDQNGVIYTDTKLIKDLDKARLYQSVMVRGYFLILGSNSTLKIASIDEIAEIFKQNRKYQEFDKYISTNGYFEMQNNAVLAHAARNGGELFKVKVIHSDGRKVSLSECPYVIDMMLRCKTGTVVDNLHPFGSTQSGLKSASFFYADDKLWGTIYMSTEYCTAEAAWWKDDPAPDKYKNHETTEGIWKKDFNDETDPGKPFVCVPMDEEKAKKFMKMQSPKVNKRWFMPGISVKDEGKLLHGIVYDDKENQFDGVCAFVPESHFTKFLRACGYNDNAKLIQIASPQMKGTIRAIPHEDFERLFKIPVCMDANMEKCAITCVFIKQAIKNKLWIPRAWDLKCDNPDCKERGTIFENTGEGLVCPNCGKDLIKVKYVSLAGKEFGIFNSDITRQENTTGTLNHQMMARGNIDRNILINKLVLRMEELQEVIMSIWDPKALVEEVSHYCYDNKLYKTTELIPIGEKLLRLANLTVQHADTASTFRGALSLLKIGMYPGHPRVLRRVQELIARALLDAKMSYSMPARKIRHDKEDIEVRYGYIYAAPATGDVPPDVVRIPKKFHNIVYQNMITIARSPIRIGDTDMATLKVDKIPSLGNVVEIHHKVFEQMQGDYDGDLVCILPVYVTGICKQTILPLQKGSETSPCLSLDDIVYETYNMVMAQASVGPTDVLTTRILTERECQKSPLTEEQKSYYHALLQGSLNAMKKSRDQLKMPNDGNQTFRDLQIREMNPVNDALYLNPIRRIEDDGESIVGIPVNIGKWLCEADVIIPNHAAKCLEWLNLIQKYARWLLSEEGWAKTYPDKAYQVLNHAYLKVLDKFSKINTAFLTMTYSITDMYKPAFKVLYDELLADVSTRVDHNLLNSFFDWIDERAIEFTHKISDYRSNLDSGSGSLDSWEVVTKYLEDVGNQFGYWLSNIAGDDERLREDLNLLGYCYSGCLGKIQDKDGNKLYISKSFPYWFCPDHIMSVVVRKYKELFNGELDEVTAANVKQHLLNIAESGALDSLVIKEE